jgi:hypothetical protein
MTQIDTHLLADLPGDIAAIGEEFSSAIHDQHGRQSARRSRARRAAVALAAVGVGSGTALGAQQIGRHAVRPGWILNRCIAREIAAPGTYTSVEQMHQACGLPYTPPSTQPPPRLPRQVTSTSSAAVRGTRTGP